MKKLFSLALICYSSVIYAEDTNPDLALEHELQTLKETYGITTASRYLEKITDTPSTVLVITQQQIQERGYTNLSQVLDDLPSINVQRYSSGMSGEKYSIRGINKQNGFLILQDGIRISSPTGDPVPMNDNFPIHYAKQIEVVYGPASTMYGADALTMVINIISEKAENINGVEIKGMAGEFNTYGTWVKAGKKINGDFSVIAGGHFKDAANANLAKYYPNNFALTDLTTFSGNTVVKAQDRTPYRGDTQSHSAYGKFTLFKDLDIGLNYSSETHRSDIGTLADFVDYGADAYLTTELGTAYANYKFEINKALSGFLRANYSWYELLPNSRFVNKYDDFTQTGGYKYGFSDRKQLEGQLQYHVNSQHTVSAGFSLEDYYSIPKTAELSHPYNPDKNPDQQTTYYMGSNNQLPVKIQSLRYTNVGGYAQWNAAWHPMLTTSVALRYDMNSKYKGTLNPKLGLVFKPTEDIVAKFSYGSAFLAPSPYFSGEQYGSFSGTNQGKYVSYFFHIPNPDLKPETIDTFEMNLDYHAAEKLNVGMRAYYNKLKNIINPQITTTPVSDYIPGGVIYATETNHNIGQLTSYGGDIHFDYAYSFSDSLLKLWGNYSYVNGKSSKEDLGGSTDLPAIATHAVKLGLTYTYQNKYMLTPKLYWIGKTHSTLPELTNPSVLQTNPSVLQTIPSYVRLDLYSSAKITKDFSLFLNVNNLLDKRYYNATEPSSALFVGSPQDPRSVSGGFIYQF